ncbi:hypothetical protein [Actinomadura harenae]|uniref:Uncharacterized protein n=1 Tax=Actinomadura harenae TaxID=2483351 RepID=A0A3M2LMF4_9ACTN|nr:hypothetical protein [Actinomadura harenae]RMI38621.1 hypothetical protein EBO15_32325 [Actinomadura harenae]
MLDVVFMAMSHMLCALSGIERQMESAREAAIAGGAVWDDVEAAAVRERVRALDEVLVNLSICEGTLSGAHMLLSHAKHAPELVDNDDGPAGAPAGQDRPTWG